MICGQGTAPQAATIAAYRDLGLDLVPGSGLLAAVVPGAFDAWMLLLRDYGTLPLSRGAGAGDRARAERLSAGAGDQRHDRAGAAAVRAGVAELGCDLSAGRRGAAAGQPVPQPGAGRHLCAHPGGGGERRAATARRRSRRRARAWYQGFVAEAIDRFCRDAGRAWTPPAGATAACCGPTTWPRWQATVEAPLTYDYHGFTLCKPGPWSQAPVALQQLALLAGFDLAALSAEDPEFVHLAAECAKLAFADREAFYGDPDFVEVPIATLLSDALQREAAASWSATQASRALRPGAIEGFGGAIPLHARTSAEDFAHAGALGDAALWRGRADRGARRRWPPSSEGRGDTCHLDVIDRHGNMVAATPSGGWLQSSPVIPELGFCLSTRGADVLARGGPAREPGARQAAAHHALALASRCATASPTWRSARRAATSRTSGRCTSSCATSISA